MRELGVRLFAALAEGPFTPPEIDRHTIEYPGYNGGSDWDSVAVDPRRGVIIANYNDMPNYDMLVSRGTAQNYDRGNGNCRGAVPPVARATAFANAGASGGSPGSPIPVGGSALGTIWTSMRGMSGMRATA